METVRIDDVHFRQSEVSFTTRSVHGNVVNLDLDPDGYADCQTMMQYSPDAARKLAAALILAADEVEGK